MTDSVPSRGREGGAGGALPDGGSPEGSGRVFGERVSGARYTLRPGGYALFVQGSGELAVIRVPEGLYLPGGGQEGDETPGEAAVRETREECGLAIRVEALVGVADQFVHAEAKRVFIRKRCAFYRAELLGEDGPAIEEDHELVWMTPAEAARSLRHASQRWAVARAFGLAEDALG